MNTFKIKTYFPSLSAYQYIEEFSNKDLLLINKYISSNDDDGLNECFNNLIPVKNVNSFDKCFALLCLRSVCIGDKINFLVTLNNSNTKTTLKVSVKSVVQKLLNSNNILNIPTFQKDDLIIKFKQPTSLYHNNLSSLLDDIIDDIIVKDKLKTIKSLRTKERLSVIQKINRDTLANIKEHIGASSSVLNITNIENFNNLKICFTNNLAFKLLKLFYNCNITNIYYKIYHASQKINLTYDNFLSLTPAEADILLTIHKTANGIK